MYISLMKMQLLRTGFGLWLMVLFCAPLCAVAQADTTSLTIPLGGNGWLSNNAAAKIDDRGLSAWANKADIVSIYVRVEAAGEINIGLKMQVPKGSSVIGLSVGKSVLSKSVPANAQAVVNFGKVTIATPGYIQIKLQGISRTGAVFADVSDVLLDGPALKGAAYVKDNKGNYFYWGHRGPSVHLNYIVPDEAKDNVEWFYNEVTVPVGNDVQGSYFMADGFTGGYFGMQVNSPTERHVLFSIWSPYQTDDPKSIPDSLKIKMLKKGAGVYKGEFGNEGAGGQSYLNYPWVAGKTYAFLVHAEADPLAKTTTYTAYFKENTQTDWMLIASFKRPRSGKYLRALYSFLENFDPETGDVTRKVFFGNQWVVDNAGKWYPISKALFTGDATANANYRKDHSGGVKGGQFYLRNCGFFNDLTPLKTPLVKETTRDHPIIDFEKLP